MVARQVNDTAATMARDRPGRLGFFAALPLFDVDASLTEIAYAFDVLGADGVSLVTSYEGRWPGDPSFAPVWEELNRRRAVVYFHPTDPPCCRDLAGAIGVTSPALEYPFDTARAIVNLITTGTILRYPDVRLLFSHGGGVAPMLQERIEFYIRDGQKGATIPNGVNRELRKLYFDTVFVTTRANFAMLQQVLPVEHLLFGTDFPYYPLPGIVGELTGLGLPPAVLRGIERENALRLFPRFRSS
jgi:predicted TIM-barrel fold metal-dependent hydrolase